MSDVFHRLQTRLPFDFYERLTRVRLEVSDAMGVKLSENQFIQLALTTYMDAHDQRAAAITYPEKNDDTLGMVAEEKETHKSPAGAQPAPKRGNHPVSRACHGTRADAIGA